MQVGGDGLFQEVLNGLLSVRGAGGKAGQVAAHLRLGHIPAGSTDAVAFSLNGTRSQATAALHIALGDRRALHCWLVQQVFRRVSYPYQGMGKEVGTAPKLRRYFDFLV